MKMKPAVAAPCALLGICALALALPACTRDRVMRPDPRPSLLEVVLDSDSPSARAAFRSMLALTTRPDERVIVIDADTGRAIGTFGAPSGPAVAVPPPPAPLPSNATLFEVASHRRAITRYDAVLRQADALIQRKWRPKLDIWMSSVVASIQGIRDGQRKSVSETNGFQRSLASVAADMASLEEAGMGLGQRRVLAVLGLDGVRTQTSPAIPGGLAGITIVVTDFSGSVGAQVTWQKALRQHGVARAVLLTQLTSDELPAVVERSLDS